MEISTAWILGAFFFFGAALFCYHGYVLMYRKMSERQLMTGGLFKYTRHPQYTGLMFLDITNWFVWERTMQFRIATMLIYLTICIACYFQEKETLARFGKAAEAYYAETPRIFFFYPIRKIVLV